ncbi:MAG: hypothetical protein KZQ58_11965 [gamma proteobacterium symbiont of Bathyaustriella thionipta]|nr:hypothetical protein [gamma proteobacterium symbiont of Bathyaustriella thionipta]
MTRKQSIAFRPWRQAPVAYKRPPYSYPAQRFAASPDYYRQTYRRPGSVVYPVRTRPVARYNMRGSAYRYRPAPAYAYRPNYVRPPVSAWAALAYYRRNAYARPLPGMPPEMAAYYRPPAARPYVPNYYAQAYNRPVMKRYPGPYPYAYGVAAMPPAPQYRQASSAVRQRYRPNTGYRPPYQPGFNQRVQFRPLSNAELASGDFKRYQPTERQWSGKPINEYQPERQGYYFRPMSG